MTSDKILNEYRKIQKIRKSAEFPFFGRPRSQRHMEQFRKLNLEIRINRDEFIDLVCSGALSMEEIGDIINVAKDSGSMKRDANMQNLWIHDALRERRDELPEGVAWGLDWCMRVHGW